MAETSELTVDQGKPGPVWIEVNNNPVKVDGPRAKGLQIKQAAIDEGVKIELDYVLAVEDAEGKRHIVGDRESVQLHDGQKFFAATGDDDS